MTGDDVKRQVMEALESVYPIDPQSQCHSQAHFALAPCSVLTPEEKKELRELDWRYPMPEPGAVGYAFRTKIRALLSPDEAGDETSSGAVASGGDTGANPSAATDDPAPDAPDEAGDDVAGVRLVTDPHCPPDTAYLIAPDEGDLPHDPPLNEDGRVLGEEGG